MATTPGSEFAEADADWLLAEGQRHDLAGRIVEAVECYATAIDRIRRVDHAPRTLSEALRRLAVLHNVRGESQAARELCRRSYEGALQAGAEDLAAEALNALAGFDVEHGFIDQATVRYGDALELAAHNPALIGKIENNLGNLASMQGNWASAAEHYAYSAAASERAHDHRGCAFAYHNLGRLHADQRQWVEALHCLEASAAMVSTAGDRHLTGLVLLNQAEVHVALERYDVARQQAEEALGAFTQLDARRDRAAAHRVLGVIFRETGRPALAESHLQSALEMARGVDCPLLIADALRELAKLHTKLERNTDALGCLGEAQVLYWRVQAHQDFIETEAEAWEIQTA